MYYFWSSSNKFHKIFWSLIFHISLPRLGYFSLKKKETQYCLIQKCDGISHRMTEQIQIFITPLRIWLKMHFKGCKSTKVLWTALKVFTLYLGGNRRWVPCALNRTSFGLYRIIFVSNTKWNLKAFMFPLLNKLATRSIKYWCCELNYSIS